MCERKETKMIPDLEEKLNNPPTKGDIYKKKDGSATYEIVENCLHRKKKRNISIICKIIEDKKNKKNEGHTVARSPGFFAVYCKKVSAGSKKKSSRKKKPKASVEQHGEITIVRM